MPLPTKRFRIKNHKRIPDSRGLCDSKPRCMLRAGVGQDKVPVLQRRGCDPESTMSCWRVRRRLGLRVGNGGEQVALEWSRFCAGIEDDECNAQYVRILEAVIGALVWDVRGFGDNGWSGTRFQGLRNCYRFFGELTATSASTTGSPLPPLPHSISTSPTPTASAACCEV